jgi:hypothetical protein
MLMPAKHPDIATAMLSTADDFKRIKGVGSVLEIRLRREILKFAHDVHECMFKTQMTLDTTLSDS